MQKLEKNMFENLRNVIEQVGKDEGIDKKILIEALEDAMLTVARKHYGFARDIEAKFNEKTGAIELHEFKTVIGDVFDDEIEISLEEARKLDPEAQEGDSMGFKMETGSLGRIAAQAAKQVIIQKVREAKKDIVFKEYINRKNEVVTGIVRKVERGDIIVDLGRTEAIVPRREQIPNEIYKPGDRIQGVITEVHDIARGPQVVISRADENYLIQLFKMEVPEIYEGIVTIKAASREPGIRAKIAVSSKDSDVDPVGACVGMKGSRVQSVVSNLRGEKIDIVPFEEDPIQFVCNAIAPAEVSRIRMNEAVKQMELIVQDDQLSLAIGKKGQNVRLAARLTGWKLDIISENEILRRAEGGQIPLRHIPGIGDANAEVLKGLGFETAQQLLDADEEKLSSLPGFSTDQIHEIKDTVLLYTEERAKTLSTLKNFFRHEVDSMEFIDSLDDKHLEIVKIPGIGLKLLRHLKLSGIETLDELLKSSIDDLATKLALTEDEASLILNTAKSFVEKRARMSIDEKLKNLKALEQGILDMSLDEQPEQEPVAESR
ncbi:MAG: transcription termination/antitermination protein NusA [Deltaproteobacteria bacterium]|nr:transcription termination/antitermination protein NusA [Deltaproteobacteria bacterium]